MNQKSRIVYLTLFLMTFFHFAYAKDYQDYTTDRDCAMNRDRMPRVTRLASAGDWSRTQAWLEAAGLSFSGSSFVGDLFHLEMGIGYPVDPDIGVFFAAGSGFHVGLSFR